MIVSRLVKRYKASDVVDMLDNVQSGDEDIMADDCDESWLESKNESEHESDGSSGNFDSGSEDDEVVQARTGDAGQDDGCMRETQTNISCARFFMGKGV